MGTATAEAVSEIPTQAVARSVWALLSCFSAVLVLPLWGFYALSSLTFQDPLEGQAAFNLLTQSALAFIRANSLELGLVMVVFTVAPMALFVAAFLTSEEKKIASLAEGRVALALNLLLLTLIVLTIPALFAVG